MQFTNPFRRFSRDDPDSYSLMAEHEHGTPEQQRYRDDDMGNMEKREYAFLDSVRSARNSVSMFFTEHLHLRKKLTRRDRVLSVLISLKPLVYPLLPVFIISPINHFTTKPGDRPRQRRLSSTAYLDGLRGVAAFIVYIFHFSYLWFPKLRYGYGWGDDNYLFWQLPIVRALHSGRSSVTVFFVISGFVLTLKTLKMLHQRKPDEAFSALAGSAFRRPFRLYLPILASTFLIAVLVFAGDYMRDPSGAPVPPVGQTIGQQLRHWFWSNVDLMNPFRPIINRENMKGSEYDGHLWTIPVEFKGSLLVFFLLLIFSRAKRWIHMFSVTGLALWLVHIGDWDQSLFCWGLLLAEISIILPANNSMQETSGSILPTFNFRPFPNITSKTLHIIRHTVTIFLFIVALHLFSYPEINGSGTPGYVIIGHIVPDYYIVSADRNQLFWNSVGAVIFIIALMYSPPVSFTLSSLLRGQNIRLPWHQTNPDLDETQKEHLAAASLTESKTQQEPFLQRLFTGSFPQYLGHISYSLYLLHGAVNHMIGVRWLGPAHAAMEGAITESNALIEGGKLSEAADLLYLAESGYGLSFFWGTLINTLALLWASDVFNRLIDVPAVKFTRWIGEKSWRKD
ncbi:hypothetical protein EsH8_IX_000289 [Colletotrichum jinshuiense]